MHCLYGGPLFDGVHLHSQGYVCMDKGKIAGFGPGSPLEWTGTSQNVQGGLISPGFIDLHSDALEKCIEPRPRAVFDHQMALQGLDHRLAANGVTSICHAVAFLDEEMGLRSPFTAADMIRSIQDFHDSDRAHVRHKVHIRFEVGGTLSAQVIRKVLKTYECALFSVMDHSPGQGQFKSLEAFMNYFAAAYALSEQEVQALGLERAESSQQAWEDSLELIHEIRSASIPILSHDDDTGPKVDMVHELGAVGSEFPVSLEAAAQARDRNMLVCMGAPNLLRGESTNSNVTAAEVIQAGLCDILVSDYAPETLPQAAFFAHRELGMDLAAVLAAITSTPCSLLKTGGMCPGWMRLGADADIVVIDTAPPWVRVVETWVGGRRVYAAH